MSNSSDSDLTASSPSTPRSATPPNAAPVAPHLGDLIGDQLPEASSSSWKGTTVISPNGKLLATSGAGSKVFVFDVTKVTEAKLVATIKDVNFHGYVFPHGLNFTPCSQYLVLQQESLNISFFKADEQFKEVKTINTNFHSVFKSSFRFQDPTSTLGQQEVAFPCYANGVVVFDVKSGKERFQRKLQNSTATCSYDLEGKYIVAFDNYGACNVLDADDGHFLVQDHPGTKKDSADCMCFYRPRNNNPDNHQNFVCGLRLREVVIWSFANPSDINVLRRFTHIPNTVYGIDVAAGSIIAAAVEGSKEGGVRFFKEEDLSPLGDVSGFQSGAMSVVFNPNDLRYSYAGGENKTLVICENPLTAFCLKKNMTVFRIREKGTSAISRALLDVWNIFRVTASFVSFVASSSSGSQVSITRSSPSSSSSSSPVVVVSSSKSPTKSSCKQSVSTSSSSSSSVSQQQQQAMQKQQQALSALKTTPVDPESGCCLHCGAFIDSEVADTCVASNLPHAKK